MQTSGFIHRFEKGRPEERALLLLHGTGGDENDLIPLARMIAPAASLLSPRGKVLENGMPRFFRRLAEGVFDEDDVRQRANELSDFVTNARTRYGIASPIVMGYSNGANIAAAMLLLRPAELAGAILLRAMPPLAPPQPVKLDGMPVLIVSGARDPIIGPSPLRNWRHCWSAMAPRWSIESYLQDTNSLKRTLRSLKAGGISRHPNS
jgi:phospholipase/carboxylesterase